MYTFDLINTKYMDRKTTNLYKTPYITLLKDIEDGKIEFIKRVNSDVFFKYKDNNQGIYIELTKKTVAICSDYLDCINTMTLVTTTFNKEESDRAFDYLTYTFFNEINMLCRSIDGNIYSNNLANEILEKKKILDDIENSNKTISSDNKGMTFKIYFESEYEKLENGVIEDNIPSGFTTEDFVDILVSKIRENGIESLSEEEKEYLSNSDVWKV